MDDVDDPAGSERTACPERPAPVLIDLDEPTPDAAAVAASEPPSRAQRNTLAPFEHVSVLRRRARRLMAVRLPKTLTGVAVAGLLTSALASVSVGAWAAVAAAPIPSTHLDGTIVLPRATRGRRWR